MYVYMYIHILLLLLSFVFVFVFVFVYYYYYYYYYYYCYYDVSERRNGGTRERCACHIRADERLALEIGSRAHICIHLSLSLYIYIYIRTHTHIDTSIYIYIYIYIYTHTYLLYVRSGSVPSEPRALPNVKSSLCPSAECRQRPGGQCRKPSASGQSGG